MALFNLLFIFLLSILAGFFPSSGPNSQSSTADVERKADINALFQKVEEHYNEYGYYPTEEDLRSNYEVKLPGLDYGALIDPNGAKVQSGDYSYKAAGCTALGCQHYTLSALLENGEQYTKESLN